MRRRLTARQEQVMALVALGRSNQHIADALSIERKTVERHLTDIYDTLGMTASNGSPRVLATLWYQRRQRAQQAYVRELAS